MSKSKILFLLVSFTLVGLIVYQLNYADKYKMEIIEKYIELDSIRISGKYIASAMEVVVDTDKTPVFDYVVNSQGLKEYDLDSGEYFLVTREETSFRVFWQILIVE